MAISHRRIVSSLMLTILASQNMLLSISSGDALVKSDGSSHLVATQDLPKDVEEIKQFVESALVDSSSNKITVKETPEGFLISKDDLKPLLQNGRVIDVIINDQEYAMIPRGVLNWLAYGFIGTLTTFAAVAVPLIAWTVKLRGRLSLIEKQWAKEQEWRTPVIGGN